MDGSFTIEKNENLDIALKKVDKKIKIKIDTFPKSSPVFVNTDYLGLSPVAIDLETGIHQVRVSRQGYEHYNHMLTLRDFDESKDLNLILKKEDPTQASYRKKINKFKNIAFFTFFPIFGAYLYCEERAGYYLDKFDSTGDRAIEDKKLFFDNASQVFRNTSIGLLITALILQIIEVEMDDVGVGVDKDKRLGVYIKW